MRTLCMLFGVVAICSAASAAETAAAEAAAPEAGVDYEVEWAYPLEQGAAAPTLFPDAQNPTGVLIATGQKVVRLTGDGTVLWEKPLDTGVATPVTVADLDQDGVYDLVFALVDSTVCCTDENGQPKWTRALDAEAGGFKNTVAADVHPSPGLEVLCGFNDGWLNCLSASGETLWRFFGDRFRVGGISVGDFKGNGAPEVVYGTDNGHIYCLTGMGDVVWRFNELAPYGRSGTNIADLNSDGVAEVLVTRSNVNNNTCLIAIDGRSGALLWRTRDVMQGYVSNAIADFNGNGQYCVLHGDKGNNVYADNADGSRRWHAALNARGMFFAPAVADIDGDGQLETITGMRGEDPETSACSFVIGSDGVVEAALDLGNGANAGPAVGDIDGDGELEVILVTQGPDQIQCLTWHATGRVAWPSLRGNSQMTACAPNVPAGTPVQSTSFAVVGQVDIQYDNVYWGTNQWHLTWDQAAEEGAFIEATTLAADGTQESRITDLRAGDREADIAWNLTSPNEVTVRVRLLKPGSGQSQFVAAKQVTALEPSFCDFANLSDVCDQAIAAGANVGADTSGIMQKRATLDTRRAAVAQLAQDGVPAAELAEAATALRQQAAELLGLAQAMQAFWGAGKAGSYVAWQDENPWDPFDPAAIPAELATDPSIKISAYKNEFEDVALTMFNVTSRTVDVRCVFRQPDTGQNWYRSEEPPADAITLRRAVPVPAQWSERVFDALPELDRSRSITIPPGEARQLWLVVKTHGLAPGKHELTLYLGSLEQNPTFREVPIEIEVWPVSLPTDVYAKMNWTRIDPKTASDQGVQDLVDHGMKVCYGPALPAIPVDANGDLAGTVDWTAFDAIIGRVSQPWTFLWGGPPSRQWPEGVKPDEDSFEYFNGFRTAIHELASHLKSKGIDYYYWAFYPIDEPWNTGFTHIPHLKHFSEMVKRADPNAQVYTDPCGLVRVEYLEEFKDLIDIWQPEVNTLKRDPQLVEWFRQKAKRFWFYEAPGPAKDFLPLGHYRANAWLAWHFGCEGSGYWIYKALDIWWPIQSGTWSAVYQTNNDVVTSRRWEADRDGIEDYRAFYVLAQEIERVRDAGHGQEADAAQALIDEAVEAIVGYNLRNIDEITRITRDYEVDWQLLCDYRVRIAEEIMKLRRL